MIPRLPYWPPSHLNLCTSTFLESGTLLTTPISTCYGQCAPYCESLSLNLEFRLDYLNYQTISVLRSDTFLLIISLTAALPRPPNFC